MMEFVSGGTLAELLRAQQGANALIPLPRAREMLVDIAQGARAINERLVHRDIKPDNILIEGSRLKISDFGISKVIDEQTRTHTFKGAQHIAYMAPEGWEIETNTFKLDVYSCWNGVLSGSTIPQLNTLPHNPADEPLTEVEVTDPTHPLFGRRFPLVSVSSSPQSAGHVLVAYRDYMRLRIPRLATNLAPAQPIGSTKLTLPAMTELIALAEQCEELCHTNPPTSGCACHPNSEPKSSTTSRRSSRR